MSKKNKTRVTTSHSNSQTGGNTMSTETTITVNPEATETKQQEGQPVEVKPEEKKTILDLVMSPFKFAWDKVLVPAYEFVKGGVLKAWNFMVSMYEREVEMFKQLGTTQYFLDRTSKALIGILKLAAAVTVAYYLAVFAQAYLNINLFAPATLLIIGAVALVMIIGKSYLTQKDAGTKFSVEQAGSHIMEAIAA